MKRPIGAKTVRLEEIEEEDTILLTQRRNLRSRCFCLRLFFSNSAIGGVVRRSSGFVRRKTLALSLNLIEMLAVKGAIGD